MIQKHLLSITIAAILMMGAAAANGQGLAVNTSGAAANSSAILDASSTTQGILIPRMTAAQLAAIASPATGLLVYQTDGTAGFYFFNGSAWVSLNSAGGTAGGDLSGSYPNPTISSGASTGNNIVSAVNASGGGLSGTKLATNSVSVNAMSATGTRNSTTYLRGDNTWATVSGGSGTVTSVSSGVATTGTTAFTDTLFKTSVSNATSTPTIFYTLTDAAAYSVWTNSTNVTNTPVYGKVHPNALYIPNGGTAGSTTFYRGDGAWATPSVSAPFSWSQHSSFANNTTLWVGAFDNNTSTVAGATGYNIAADVIGRTGTIDSMDYYVTISQIQTGSNTVTWTVWYDGAMTSMTGNIALPATGSVGDVVGRVTSTSSFSVTAGHTIAVAFSQSNGASGTRCNASWAFYGH